MPNWDELDLPPQNGYGATGAPLADRGVRLGAAMLDGLFWGIAMSPYFIGTVIVTAVRGATPDPGIEFVLMGGAGLLVLGYLCFQLVLLSQNGWTLGKKLCKIRIVRCDGSKASLGRIFWLRMFIKTLITWIPCAGPIFSLVDTLFIFSENRRCIHDLIADTKVVTAS